jgi:hypothetical protein
MRTKSKRVPQPGPMPTGPIAKITAFHETVRNPLPASEPIVAPEALPPAPTESDPIDKLKQIAVEAAAVIVRSNSGYVTAGYHSLGRCLQYAKIHFAGDKVAYTAWEKSLMLPGWAYTRARIIASRFKTQAAAAQVDVVTAISKNFVAPVEGDTQRTTPQRPVKVHVCLTKAVQLANDIEKHLAEVPDVDFLDSFTSVENLAKQFGLIAANPNHLARAAKLTAAKEAKSLIVVTPS